MVWKKEKRDKINTNLSQSPPRVHHKYNINQKCQFTHIIHYTKLLIQLYSGPGLSLSEMFFFFFFLMEHASVALTNTIIDY